MSTAIKDISDSIKVRIAAELPDYSELAYKRTLEKNNFRTTSKRYGVLPLSGNQIDGVTKHMTMVMTFELTLTDQYFETNIDDTKKDISAMELRQNWLKVYRDLVKSKAGLPSQVMQVTSAELQEPEFLDDQKVVALRGRCDITFRINL